MTLEPIDAAFKSGGAFFATKSGGFFKSTGKVLGKAARATGRAAKKTGVFAAEAGSNFKNTRLYEDATSKYKSKKTDLSGLSKSELEEKVAKQKLIKEFGELSPKKVGPVTRFNNATKAHRERVIAKQKYRSDVLAQKTTQYQYRQQLPKKANKVGFGNINKSHGGPLADKGNASKISGKNISGGFYSKGGRGGPLSDHKAKPKSNPVTGDGGFFNGVGNKEPKKGGGFFG